MNLRALPALLFTAFLAACGGGGGGGGGSGHDLTLAFDYATPLSETLFAPISDTPTISGLEGNTPKCSVTSGALAPGLSLGSNCVIAGTPTHVGTYSATITLTVDGFKGSVTTSITDTVLPIALDKVVDTGGVSTGAVGGDRNLQLLTPISALQVVALSRPPTRFYVAQPGDTFSYSVASGALPAGLVLNTATGMVSGTPSVFGLSTVSFALTVTHAGQPFTTAPVALTFKVFEGTFTLSYVNCCVNGKVGDLVNLVPTSTYVPVPGATSRFILDSSFGLQGPTLDPNTGIYSGRIAKGGDGQGFRITQLVTYPDGTTASAYWNSGRIDILGFGNCYAVFNLGTRPNVAFSFSPAGATGTVAGDTLSYAIAPTAPATAPLPTWLSFDKATGRLYGTAPGTGTNYNVAVTLTTQLVRDGLPYSSSCNADVEVDAG